ncbi:glycoside hydrolase family protein, partial [Trypanosoma theileri]
VLFAVCCPSGRLAETFPKRLEDTPTFPFYPEKEDAVYREGIFVGYRYYDIKRIEPLFPFGHGLSYTEFQYSDLAVEVKHTKKENQSDTTLDGGAQDVLVLVSLTVKNTGKMAGKEVVQLYVQDVYAPVLRPEKELKEFAKVLLQPGESKRVTFELNRRSFAYYDEKAKEWRVHDGKYTILVGASSRDIRLQAQVEAFHEKVNDIPEIHRNIAIKEAFRFPETVQQARELMNRLGISGMTEGTPFYELFSNFSIRAVCRMVGVNDEEMEGFLQKLRLASSKAKAKGSNGAE